MSEVCEDSFWCDVVLEKVEELGEPVRGDEDDCRPCNVALAGGLNERVVAIFLVSRIFNGSTVLRHAHLREFSCPIQCDAAEPQRLMDVAVKPTLICRI